jgi:hypothetical protein
MANFLLNCLQFEAIIHIQSTNLEEIDTAWQCTREDLLKKIRHKDFYSAQGKGCKASQAKSKHRHNMKGGNFEVNICKVSK